MAKALIVLLLTILPISAIWSQWLPVYSHGIGWEAPMPVVESPYEGDTLDGKYAIMKYGEHAWGARARSVLKYNALDTIQVWEHYTLYIYGRIPENADLVATMMTDSTIWSVLYTTVVTRLDNTPAKPKDTVLTVDVPPYSIFHYGKPFWRFALIRDYRNLRWASRDDIFIDGIFLVVHPQDTVVNPRDTTQDTITIKEDLSVQPLKKKTSGVISPAYPVDILGRRADTTRASYWFVRDSNGYWRIRIRKR